MPNQAILNAVADSRKEFQKAERSFNQRGESLASRARHTTMSVSNMNQARQFIREGVRNTADFFIAGETIILALDAFCRPLLAQNPDARAVGAISDLMKEIITSMDGSSTTFSVSLNGMDLGDVGEVAPKPGMEARVVQRFWEQHYRTMPGYAQEEQRRKAEQEEKRRQEKEAAAQAKAAADRARAQIEDRKRKNAAVEARRNALKEKCDTAVAQYRESSEAYILQFRAELEKKAAAEAAALTAQKKTLLAQRKSLRGAARTEIDQRIARIDVEQLAVSSAGYIDAQLELCRKKAEDMVQAYRQQLNAHLDKCYTLRQESYSVEIQAPASKSAFSGMNNLEESVLDAVSDLGWCTVSQIAEYIYGDYTNQRIAATLRRLVDQGQVCRVEEERKALFALPGTPYSGTTGVWTENTNLVHAPLPGAKPISFREADYDASGYKEEFIENHILSTRQAKKSRSTKVTAVLLVLVAVIGWFALSRFRQQKETARREQVTAMAEEELTRVLRTAMEEGAFYDEDFYTVTDISSSVMDVIFVKKKDLLYGGNDHYQVKMRIDCTMENLTMSIKDSELTSLLAYDISDELPRFLGKVDDYNIHLFTESVKNSDELFGGAIYEYNMKYLVYIYINGVFVSGPTL